MQASVPAAPALFVYGTLQAAECAHARLHAAGPVQFLGPATAPGRLYDLGDWPGFVPDAAAATRVHGELYSVQQMAKLLPLLDIYEACPGTTATEILFVRTLLSVQLSNSEPHLAWVYTYVGSIAQALLLPQGRWRRAPPSST